jgi:hypothetical protein
MTLRLARTSTLICLSLPVRFLVTFCRIPPSRDAHALVRLHRQTEHYGSADHPRHGHVLIPRAPCTRLMIYLRPRTSANVRNTGSYQEASAYAGLGDCYVYGWRVPIDYAEACKQYQKGATLEDPLCLARLGMFYWNGWGGLKQVSLLCRTLFEIRLSREYIFPIVMTQVQTIPRDETCSHPPFVPMYTVDQPHSRPLATVPRTIGTTGSLGGHHVV